MIKINFKNLTLGLGLVIVGSAAGMEKADFSNVKTVKTPKTIEQIIGAAKGEMKKTPARASESEESYGMPIVNESVKVTTLVNEDFSKWTEGSLESPYDFPVDSSDPEVVAALMNTPDADWLLFQTYQAGGCAFTGYDNMGSDGAGYIMLSGVDVPGEDKETGYYRFTCTAMNLNENDQTQILQAMIFDEVSGWMMGGGPGPLGYKEWTTSTWISEATSKLTGFMAFGWRGEVAFKEFKVERLEYPLTTPVVTDFGLNENCEVYATWEKVPGATSYTVAIWRMEQECMAYLELGDVDQCTFESFPINDRDYYSVRVTAYGDDNKISYPGIDANLLVPAGVGKANALAATDVDAEGYTANWEFTDYANRFLVFPTITHTAATNNDEYVYFDGAVRGVPTTQTLEDPISVYGNVDMYTTTAGWSAQMLQFYWNAELDQPVMGIWNFPLFGFPGKVATPAIEFSASEGKVTISGVAYSITDDVVLGISTVNPFDNATEVGTFEVSPEAAPFEFTIADFPSLSKLQMSIEECAEGGDHVFFADLKLSVELPQGESTTFPGKTVFVDDSSTSVRVETPVDEYNHNSYRVMGYFYPGNVKGEVSEEIEVETPPSVVKELNGLDDASIKVGGGLIIIDNPSCQNCAVFGLDGTCLLESSDNNISFAVEKGIYIVRIGEKIYKILN